MPARREVGIRVTGWSQQLEERAVLEHDHLLDPVRPQLLEKGQEIELLAAELRV